MKKSINRIIVCITVITMLFVITAFTGCNNDAYWQARLAEIQNRLDALELENYNQQRELERIEEENRKLNDTNNNLLNNQQPRFRTGGVFEFALMDLSKRIGSGSSGINPRGYEMLFRYTFEPANITSSSGLKLGWHYENFDDNIYDSNPPFLVEFYSRERLENADIVVRMRSEFLGVPHALFNNPNPNIFHVELNGQQIIFDPFDLSCGNMRDITLTNNATILEGYNTIRIMVRSFGQGIVYGVEAPQLAHIRVQHRDIDLAGLFWRPHIYNLVRYQKWHGVSHSAITRPIDNWWNVSSWNW